MTTILVVMGVSGAGKSTVARLLADRNGWDFQEGDSLHPPGNVAKMAAGQPLSDADRMPWLRLVAGWVDHQIADGRSGVITCSALKRNYRDQLRRPQVRFVYLQVAQAELRRRLTERTGHFMPASLLESQLAALQPPEADERAVTVDAELSPQETLKRICAALERDQ